MQPQTSIHIMARIVKMIMTSCFLFYLFFTITACNSSDTTVKIEQINAGIWKISAGKPEIVNLLSELDITPRDEAIQKMGKAVSPVTAEEIEFKIIDGKTYIRFPLEKDEKIFGLGLNFKTVEQRGRVMRLHTDHYSGRDDGRTQAPVPFFVSSKGYGALINSARYIDAWIGTGVRKDSKNPPIARDRNTDPRWSSRPYSDNMEFLIPAEGVEILLFAGPTMLEAIQRFNLYNGGGALPPRWGLGFWHRTPTLYSDRQVMSEVEEFRKREFPLTVIGLEPGWMSHAYPCSYEWDTTRFPDPAGFVKSLNDKHIKTNVWINPYISPATKLYEKMEPYTASHSVWCGIVPDYTLPEAQQIADNHFKKNQLDIGVNGYKLDENDGYDYWLWPDVATFPSGNAAEQIRQIYGSLLQNMTVRMYHKQNKRTYGLVRSGNAGTPSFPYVIYNDYYNHKDFITALINSSFIGILWTPEVRASQTAEEWLRRMQTVCFSPIAMLDAWADGTKPWSFPEVTQQVNDIAKLRMQLIPYLYTTFANYAFKGIPPVRAMNLEEGYQEESKLEEGKLDATANPYAMALKKEVKDQFMVGEYLLVAPLFTGETERRVILPKGKWYDFYTGKLAGEGEIITVSPGLDRIPVYVKDGGIIPLWPAITELENRQYPLEIRHYGEKTSNYNLYDDDGETYNYEKGECTWISLKVDSDTKGGKRGVVIIPENSKVWSFSDYRFRFMSSEETK